MRKPKAKVAVLFLVLAGVVLPQTSSLQLLTPEVRRVGDRLACKCGVCNNTVATCQMLQCHYSQPAREKISKLQSEGVKDDAIVQSFVQESGIVALAAPPTSGFNLLAYVMPFILITFGTLGIAYWLKRIRKPRTAVVADGPELDERYRERVEKVTADLD